jgi:hypothetical protein
MSTIVAELISPDVADLPKSDSTLSFFPFNNPVEFIHLTHFVSLGEGTSVSFHREDFDNYLEISKEFGNISVFLSFYFPYRLSSPEAISNILSELISFRRP